jgi:hypothetical protein
MDFDNQQKPSIVIRKFFTTYKMAGEKTIAIDWVEYAPAHDPQGTVNRARVKDLIPPENGVMNNDDSGTKYNIMMYKWVQIEKAYKAWKEGREIPVDGTPLAAWAGLTPEQAEIFATHGLKTVESIAEGSESLVSKVRLPGVMKIRDLAKEYLSSRGDVQKAAEVQNLRDEVSILKEMLEEALAVKNPAPAPAKAAKAKPAEAEAA